MSVEKWHVSDYTISLEFKRGYWRWAVSNVHSKREYTGKDKDKAYALCEALTELNRISVRDGITQPTHLDIDPIHWD